MIPIWCGCWRGRARPRSGWSILRRSRAGADAVRARLADLAGQGLWRRHHRCGVRPRSRNHRQRGAGSSAVGRRLRHRARPCPGAGRVRQGQIECGERASPMRRSAVRPRASPAVARRRRCSRSPTPRRSMPVLHLDPERVVAGPDEARRALAWAKERIGDGPVLIASSSTPDQVAALQSRHGRDAAGHAIEQAMADIAEGLVQSGVRRLVVAGGETSGAVVDRLRDSRLSRRRGNRCRRAGFARGRRKERRDAACTEIRQFRRAGIFLRCAQADALMRQRVHFACRHLSRYRNFTGRQINATSGASGLMPRQSFLRLIRFIRDSSQSERPRPKPRDSRHARQVSRSAPKSSPSLPSCSSR